MTSNPCGGPSTPPWLRTGNRLVSWWDVEYFAAGVFCDIVSTLATARLQMENQVLRDLAPAALVRNLDTQMCNPGFDIGPEYQGAIKFHVERVVDECNKIGLRTTAAMASHLLLELESGTSLRSQHATLDAIQRTLKFELTGHVFVFIPDEVASYYRRDAAFGDAVEIRFPSASFDIKEAGNCVATERSTACMFHLMRVMEVGLKTLGKLLGIPYAPSWESYLSQINKKLAEPYRSNASWKSDTGVLKSFAADILTVKYVWRNPTMHIVNVYTQDEAKNAYAAVKAFMAHLAEFPFLIANSEVGTTNDPTE